MNSADTIDKRDMPVPLVCPSCFTTHPNVVGETSGHEYVVLPCHCKVKAEEVNRRLREARV